MIERTVQITLTDKEEFEIVRNYVSKHPKVIEVLLEHPKGYCSFVNECKKFP